LSRDASAPSVTVTLTVDETGPSALSTTRYQINSGAPQIYDVPFVLDDDGVHTVTFWSEDVAGNVEVAQGVTVRIDTVAPVSEVSLSETAWTNQPVTVTLSAEDEEGGSGVAYIHYRLGNGPDTIYSGPFAVSSHGEQTLTYWAVDNAGNVEASRTATILIDTVPPTLTGQASDDNLGLGGWYVDDITVQWTCADADSGIAGDCPADTILTEEGSTLTAAAHVYDNAGNRTDASVTGLKLDRTPPVTTASIDPEGNDQGWNNQAVTVTLTGFDELSGVASTSYRIDGGAWTTVDEGLPAQVPFADDGVYLLEFLSRDAAGNTETKRSVEVKVDQTAPTITASEDPEPNAAGWNNTPVRVSFICEDGLSGIAYCTDLVEVDREVVDHPVTGTAVDNAGNEIERPSVRHSISIRQPLPAYSGPPINASSGTNTSVPRTGPLWNGMFSGKCRRPISRPGVSRGTSASVMPRSSSPPSRPSGSYRRNARPTTVAIGASVM
jgi:hypothetical protein